MKHPFIGIFEDQVQLYKAVSQVCECCQRPFDEQMVPATNYKKASLKQAEREIIKLIMDEVPASVTFSESHNESFLEGLGTLSLLLLRATNVIQYRLRGVVADNVAIVNPWTFEEYREAFQAYGWEEKHGHLAGWSQVGVINKSILVFTGPVPADVVVVFKHGSEERSIAGYSEQLGFALNGPGYTWQDWCNVISLQKPSIKYA